MKLSFRGKLTLLFFALSLTPLAISTLFFLSTYKNDKLAALFEGSLNDAIQGASRMDNMIAASRVLDPAQVRESHEIIVLGMNPCEAADKPPAQVILSKIHEKTMERLKLGPDYWVKTPGIRTACVTRAGKLDKKPALLLAGPKFPIPYLYVYLPSPEGDRLVALSMDGVGGGSEATVIFITDADGKIVWSDGTAKQIQELEQRYAPEIARFTTDAIQKNIPSITPSATGGHIIASAPSSSGYVFFTITDENVALAPVLFVLNQSVLFAVGWMFLYLLVGKFAAARISKPLIELRKASERFGGGDLLTRIKVTGDDELSQVQRTFNEMGEQIVRLVEDTKNKAAIESDMAIAEKVQQWFFPNKKIIVQGHELNSSVEMAQSCGGDWWGYVEVPRPDGSPLLVLMIGDAVGHGISSALLTAATQGGMAVMDTWIAQAPGMAADPRMILRLFNQVMFRTTRGEMHMTFFVAVLDGDAETITVANAGHNKPYLIVPKTVGTGADVKPLGGAGPVLGSNPDETFREIETFPWKIGDQLFLYTDGLIDCTKGDKNLYERRTLVQFLKRFGHLKRDALINTLLKERGKLIGKLKQEDDVTAVVCTRLASPMKVAKAPPIPPPMPRPPKNKPPEGTPS